MQGYGCPAGRPGYPAGPGRLQTWGGYIPLPAVFHGTILRLFFGSWGPTFIRSPTP
nr:MAG TPA: hypothetical protein [Caudoviricetes sp.]